MYTNLSYTKMLKGLRAFLFLVVFALIMFGNNQWQYGRELSSVQQFSSEWTQKIQRRNIRTLYLLPILDVALVVGALGIITRDRPVKKFGKRYERHLQGAHR